ncbi:TetR/AcrR family transcriptional regulator [Gordonia sinesedis]
MTAPTRRRDPERRRREIVDAAIAVVLEEGTSALTHRKVATRAGVPLGSTTQYFATLDDLRTAAVLRIVGDIDVWIDALDTAFERDGAIPATYAAELSAFLSDPHLVQAAFALTGSGITADEVQTASRQWTTRFIEMLQRHTTLDGARAIAALTDGLTMHVALLDEPPSPDFLTRAITAVWDL